MNDKKYQVRSSSLLTPTVLKNVLCMYSFSTYPYMFTKYRHMLTQVINKKNDFSISHSKFSCLYFQYYFLIFCNYSLKLNSTKAFLSVDLRFAICASITSSVIVEFASCIFILNATDLKPS